MTIRMDKERRLKPISYTYVWYLIKEDKHIPFYVGKGKGTRYMAEAHFYNNEFKRIYDKYICYYKKVLENVSDYDAIEKEIELIKKIGRRDLSLGTLINHTDGGDGTAGRVFTEEQLKRQHEILKNIHNDPMMREKRIMNLKKILATNRYRENLSKSLKEKFKNDKEHYNKIAECNRKRMEDPKHLNRMKNMSKLYFTEEVRKKISLAGKMQWTEEKRKQQSEKMKNLYKDDQERKKTAEATKKGMEKLTKEQKSRRHLSKVPIETLFEMIKDKHLTQLQLVEKYNIGIALSKRIKSGNHWIYDYIKENNIDINNVTE